MPRAPRRDAPGAIHHVFARGIAQRAVFESRSDVRYFLACLAREVRAGEIHILGFAIMTNHFHLVVRSVLGRLSDVMRRVLYAYVRRFNRAHRRDGPLFRGRFGSRVVDSGAYLAILHVYVEQNPVQAGLAARAWDYPYGSAAYCVADRRPRWLDTTRFDARVKASSGGERRSRAAEVFGSRPSGAQRWLVERRMAVATSGGDALDLLVQGDAGAIRRWLARRAMEADGSSASAPTVPDALVGQACAWGRTRDPTWGREGVTRDGIDRWDVLEAALRRELSGQTLRAIARAMEGPAWIVRVSLREHARRLLEDDAYATRAARVVTWCAGMVVGP